MKKLFTTYWQSYASTSHLCPGLEYSSVVVNTYFLQNCVANLLNGNDFKCEINIRLISFNFFVDFATYPKVNPLLLTYSAEITHTYRQTLTTSFTFSRPADVLPSVLFGSIPKSNTTVSGWK
ncbi:hypothetical protein [Emticicia sp. BO119]|uniref:hypothetical protein n=1 Tax=Emticicia sp. BO119 TaxID=2757768 RepID=UPI0015F0BE2D|nr:hypothetical protein [Emticicia sp. BO119]MBA4849236.1 hypothetical protein [Emticicia sp. BO119]